MRRVMVVEDELLTRTGIRMLIPWEENGFELAAEATDGRDALEILGRESIDIVITDIRMPVMDGLELLKEIRMRECPCEVVILSGFDDFAYVKEAMVLGARDYIHKPTMTPEDVITTLRRIDMQMAKREEQSGAEGLFQKQKSGLLKCLEEWVKAEDAEMGQEVVLMKEKRFVAGVLRVLFQEAEKKTEECLLKLDAQICEVWEREMLGERELSALYRAWDCWYFVRETPFEEEEVQKLKQLCAQTAEVSCFWSETRYKSPFVNMKAIVPILLVRVNEAYARETELIALSSHVRQTVIMIQEHFAENITLETIAAQIHVNASYLSRIFQKETGRTFGEYLTNRRLEEARRLLRESEYTIAQIAEKSGYGNDKYFMNLFKKHMGCTPGAYRKEKKENQKDQN